MERVKTGIKGLDAMLNGGVPNRHHILVCGGPGTGKTMLGLEFLYHGAKAGEPGLFISLEEIPSRIIENVKATFPKWNDFEELIEKKKISIVKPDRFDFTNFSDIIQSYVTHRGVRRVVVDSATLLKISFERAIEFRKALVDFTIFARGLDCTLLFTAELPVAERGRVRFSIEQFIADGVIILYNIEKAERRVRALEVLKMRGTSHSQDLVPMKFTPSGIEVFVGEKVY